MFSAQSQLKMIINSTGTGNGTMTMIGMLVAWIAAAAAGLFWWRRGVMATVEGTPARRKAVPTAPMRSVEPIGTRA